MAKQVMSFRLNPEISTALTLISGLTDWTPTSLVRDGLEGAIKNNEAFIELLSRSPSVQELKKNIATDVRVTEEDEFVRRVTDGLNDDSYHNMRNYFLGVSLRNKYLLR